MEDKDIRGDLTSDSVTTESRSEAARCTDQQACCPDARYDAIAHGAYSVTLKCRVCGIVIRRDWD